MLVALGRMCVFNQDNRVAKRQRSASGGVYAKFRVHPANHEICNVMRLQDLLQSSAMKRVGRGFPDAQIRCFCMKVVSQLPCIGFELKVSRRRFMLDEDYQGASRTCLLQNPVDSRDDLPRFEGVVLAFAQALLDIDDEQCCVHGLAMVVGGWQRATVAGFSRRPEPRRSGPRIGADFQVWCSVGSWHAIQSLLPSGSRKYAP